MKRSAHKNGFTLIEISTVLAVISLVVGGVVVGRNVLRNSQINRVAQDAHQYISAVKSFRGEYGYLPGDLPTATKIWGSTANGDGDGRIEGPPNWTEMFSAWQHLSNAGLIAGTFSGSFSTTADGRGVGVIDLNTPGGPLDNSGWTMINLTTRQGVNSEFGYSDGNASRFLNFLIFGRERPDDYANNPIMSGNDAFVIDTKYDDGSPGTGNIMGGLPLTCTVGNTINGATYAATNATVCYLGFIF